jgi:hypothetical protein
MKINQRRAFVLPLVFLLSLVIAMGLTLAVERNTMKANNVRRQVRAYREHHAAKGIQEAVSAWLNLQNARTVSDALGENGHALDMVLPDRSIVKVYLKDGQGTILDPAAAGARDYEDALAIQQRLRLLCREAKVGFEQYERPIGPFAISVNDADPLVLQAVAEHLLGIDQGADLVTRLRDAIADKGQLERQDLLGIATDLGLEGETRNTLLALMTATPELWFVTVELYGGGAATTSQLTARYGGLVPLPSGSRSSSGGAWEQPGVFLTWEDLGVEYDLDGGTRP